MKLLTVTQLRRVTVISMSGKPVVVVGSTHMDFTIYVDHLPKTGETVIGEKFLMSPGGKGANQAVAVARLGAKSYLVSRVGTDYIGEQLIQNLIRNGVDTTYVTRDPTTYTGIALIMVDRDGRNIIAVAPGTDLKVSKEDIDRAEEIIKRASIMLLQLEIPIETVVYAARKAYSYGVKVILNPAPARKLPSEIYKYIHTITPNVVEAETLSGIKIETRDDMIKAARKLQDLGVKNVVITLGEEGALLVTEETVKHVPTFKVTAIDTTGAGDAFNGALAVALAEGKTMEEAVLIANAAAALKCTKPGAQTGLPWREELRNFIKEKVGRQLI